MPLPPIHTKMSVVSSFVVGAMENEKKKKKNRNIFLSHLTKTINRAEISYTNTNSQGSRCFKRTSKIRLVQIAVEQ